ncbi:unnamed protein product, partial [Sphacelaria rigidula]
MGGLTTTAHASVLGSLQPQSLYSVWNGLSTNTVGYDYFRATGQRMVFAAGVEPSFADSVLPVQIRDLISSRTRGRRAAETATKLAVSGPDLPPPVPTPVPDSFLSPPQPPRRKAPRKSTPTVPPLPTIAETTAVPPSSGDDIANT